MPVLHVMNHCYRYRCPELVNPAEFLADLMSIDNSSAESVYSSQKRIHGLVESFSQQTSSILYATLVRRETSRNNMNLGKKTIVKKKVVGGGSSGCSLNVHGCRLLAMGLQTKFVQGCQLFLGLFSGGWEDLSSTQDRMGLLQVAAISMAMAFLTKTGGVFPKERVIVDRECAEGSYALGPYLLSKLLAEIPVGAAFPLLFGTILYPMARLRPSLSSETTICGYFSQNRTGNKFRARIVQKGLQKERLL